ncbi:MAG: porin family protein [Polaribacter sp.]|jgi:hypothetical protein
MKKVILVVFLALGLSQVSNAQIDFGIKAGINYNNNGEDAFKDATNDIAEGASAKTGYHAGIWFRGKLPILGLYLRPEIIYTEVKSEFEVLARTEDYNFKKLDVPVLVGKKILGFAHVFAGPSFQYILEDKIDFSSLSTDEFDKFTVGMQFGAGVEFDNIGIDVRWERGLTNSEAKFANNTKIDNRVNQIIFGVSLKF